MTANRRLPLLYDLAVNLDEGPVSLKQLRKVEGILFPKRPLHLRVPDGTVAFLQGADSSIAFLFRAESLGHNGRFVRARHGTIRRPRGPDPHRIPIRFRNRALFRYFDLKTRKSVNISGIGIQLGDYGHHKIYTSHKGVLRVIMEGLIVPTAGESLRPLWDAFGGSKVWLPVAKQSKKQWSLKHVRYSGRVTLRWRGSSITYRIEMSGKVDGKISGALIGHVHRHSHGSVGQLEAHFPERQRSYWPT